MAMKTEILVPILTEKTIKLASESKFTFKVSPRLNKPEVKKLVGKIFKVTPLKVNIFNIHPQRRVFRKSPGKTKAYAKAIVTLKKGEWIEAFKVVEKEKKKAKKQKGEKT